ncbi:MAG: phosphomannomutase, partial [Ghiorsea sp.]|nr:phosphomannomutase [Ghiorsea sp.]
MNTADFPHHIFRAYDIRGLVDTEVTEAFATCLAQSFTRFLPTETTAPIVVGRDVRLSGLKLQQALIQAL